MARYSSKKPTHLVGVRELRQNLSIYLDRVKKGEALTVTERGEAVAILRPMPRLTDTIERLIAEGRATRPTRDIRDVIEHVRKVRQPWAGDKPLDEVLDEIREDII
jgi:antitoxin (DNA-binding transcriptional repressor) of toxin-antitoxin stability system